MEKPAGIISDVPVSLGKRPDDDSATTEPPPKRPTVDELRDNDVTSQALRGDDVSREPKSDAQPPSVPDYQQIERQLMEYLRTKELKDSDYESRDSICTELQALLRTSVTDCRVVVFGSTVNRLGATGCDLDVYLEVPSLQQSSARSSQKARDITKVMKQVAAAVKASPKFTVKLEILRATVPLLKIQHGGSGLEIDLSVCNESALLNSELTAFLCDSDTRIRRFFFLLKEWAKSRELLITGNGITSYSLVLLAMFHLQSCDPVILPPIVQLAKSPSAKPRQIDGWDASLDRNEALLPLGTTPSTAIELFASFLKFYSTFDFSGLVICPRVAKAVAVGDFANQSEWKDNNVSRFKMNPLKLQDPFTLDRNAMSGASELTKERLLSAMSDTSSLCNSRDFSDIQQLLQVDAPESDTPSGPVDANVGDFSTTAGSSSVSLSAADLPAPSGRPPAAASTDRSEDKSAADDNDAVATTDSH